ncbi:hypothetical protein ABES25_04655 [Bacillus gobiensis]|uniref:hypothetical protein n=1 Tax=Bacillus gobiensis TaxID=1441095 RepID=UPI003D20D118
MNQFQPRKVNLTYHSFDEGEPTSEVLNDAVMITPDIILGYFDEQDGDLMFYAAEDLEKIGDTYHLYNDERYPRYVSLSISKRSADMKKLDILALGRMTVAELIRTGFDM